MDERTVRVLLIGESAGSFSSLLQRLEEQGCGCKFASSYAEGVRFFADQPFDLVLCSGRPGIRALFPPVISSSASLFCAHAIEDSCLWVPVIVHGDECLGKPPLRPREFADTLSQLVDEIRSSPGDGAVQPRTSGSASRADIPLKEASQDGRPAALGHVRDGSLWRGAPDPREQGSSKYHRYEKEPKSDA